MSSPVLLNLLRCGRFSMCRQALFALEASTQSGQVNPSTQIYRVAINFTKMA